MFGVLRRALLFLKKIKKREVLSIRLSAKSRTAIRGFSSLGPHLALSKTYRVFSCVFGVINYCKGTFCPGVWYNLLVKFIGTIYWYILFVQFIGTICWYNLLVHLLVQFIGTICWYNLLVQFIGKSYW